MPLRQQRLAIDRLAADDRAADLNERCQRQFGKVKGRGTAERPRRVERNDERDTLAGPRGILG